jgi:F0F1-type ATP synthase assembly protein I
MVVFLGLGAAAGIMNVVRSRQAHAGGTRNR